MTIQEKIQPKAKSETQDAVNDSTSHGDHQPNFDVVRETAKFGTAIFQRPPDPAIDTHFGTPIIEQSGTARQMTQFDAAKPVPERSGASTGDIVLAQNQPQPQTGADSLPVSRDRLTAEVAKHPGVSQSLLTEMQDFERAAAARHLPETEVAKTYQEITRLLQAGDNPNVPLHAADRERLATQILDHATHTNDIEQGQHNTCALGDLEIRTYTRDPSVAAKMVTDLATTGEFTSASGTHVKLDPGSIAPHDEALGAHVDQARDHASQLFQIGAANDYYAKIGSSTRYEQKEPDRTAVPPDTGERLMDYSTNPPTEVGRPGLMSRWFGAADIGDRQPDMTLNRIEQIGNDLTGRNETGWVISPSDVHSPQELAQKLEQAKRDGKFPVLLYVNAFNEPFYTDGGFRASHTPVDEGGHGVVVTDYQAGPPPRIQYDNTWGSSADHLTPSTAVTPDQLYFAMRAPADGDQLKQLGERVKELRNSGNFDEGLELEYLRREKLAGPVDDMTYLHQFQSMLQFAGAYHRGGHPITPELFNQLQDEIRQLPYAPQLILQNELRNQGEITSDSFMKFAAHTYGLSEKDRTANGNDYMWVRATINAILDELGPADQETFRQLLRQAEQGQL